MNNKSTIKHNFKIINNKKVSKVNILLFLFVSTVFLYFIIEFNMFYKIFEFKEKIIYLYLFFIFIYFIFSYTFFNDVKIYIKELYFTHDNKLNIKYSFMGDIKEITLNLNDLNFRIEHRLNHNNEIVIHDNYYKRIFKIRGTAGIESEDLEKIAISFRNADVNEFKKTIFGIETFKDGWRIIKTNYLSKDLFRNFWYV